MECKVENSIIYNNKGVQHCSKKVQDQMQTQGRHLKLQIQVTEISARWKSTAVKRYLVNIQSSGKCTGKNLGWMKLKKPCGVSLEMLHERMDFLAGYGKYYLAT